ncbi:MAG: RAMP superfamily CRISPR-associated protein [Thermofilaceae archaeon]
MPRPSPTAGRAERERARVEGEEQRRFKVPKKLLGELPKLNVDTNFLSYVVMIGFGILLEGDDDRAADKRVLLEMLCSVLSQFSFSQVQKHLERVREALLLNGYSLKVCRMVTTTRTVVGAGGSFGKVPFELGLSFDPILNVPYIPASSLKGAFRHALEELRGKDLARLLFGEEGEVGVVGVTDAYPVGVVSELQGRSGRGAAARLLEPDVLSPHYPETKKLETELYPETKKLETELDVEPKPVVFAAIAPGVVFEFYLYYNRDLRAELGGRIADASSELNSKKHIFEGDLATVNNVTIDVLPSLDLAVLYALSRGVGAKTSIGYSRFELLEYKSVR